MGLLHTFEALENRRMLAATPTAVADAAAAEVTRITTTTVFAEFIEADAQGIETALFVTAFNQTINGATSSNVHVTFFAWDFASGTTLVDVAGDSTDCVLTINPGLTRADLTASIEVHEVVGLGTYDLDLTLQWDGDKPGAISASGDSQYQIVAATVSGTASINAAPLAGVNLAQGFVGADMRSLKEIIVTKPSSLLFSSVPVVSS